MSSVPSRPRLLRRRVIYDGRIIRVEVDHVRFPDGRRTAFELVRHRGSVVLLAQPSARTIVLIRQFRYAVGRWLWELPAGSREPGERPSDCARRECEEEIGLTPRRVQRGASCYPSPGFCDERMVFYRRLQLSPPNRPVARDVDEQIEPRTFSIAAARRLIARGDIIDMKTVVGLGFLKS
jgi:ADP-ribose pyrophosphatase